MVFYLRQLINQSQIAKGHKSMPRYSNLKLKPNLQADVVLFKGKENVLSQEQKALNNLNALLEQNIINPELNTFLTKEVNSKNKNVIKYLNEIKATNDPNLKGRKAVAERLVANHSQLSGAIVSMKSVDDETKQKLDLDNQKRMEQEIEEIYTKDELAINNIVEASNVSFGMGTKAKAELVVAGFSTAAAGIAAGMAQVPFSDQGPLMANDIAMAIAVGKVYGVKVKENMAKSLVASSLGNQLGTGIFKGIMGLIPGIGNGVNAAVAAATTETVGNLLIEHFQEETGDYS